MKSLALCLVLCAVRSASAGEPSAAEAWQALHPGQPAPPECKHLDPLRRARAGEGTVLASLRWGVILLGADGKPLASIDLGCGSRDESAPQVLELAAVDHVSAPGSHDLIVRTTRSGHCGTVTDWTLLTRRDRALTPLLTVDEDVALSCSGHTRDEHGTHVKFLRPGRLLVISAGKGQEWQMGKSGKFEPVR